MRRHGHLLLISSHFHIVKSFSGFSDEVLLHCRELVESLVELFYSQGVQVAIRIGIDTGDAAQMGQN